MRIAKTTVRCPKCKGQDFTANNVMTGVGELAEFRNGVCVEPIGTSIVADGMKYHVIPNGLNNIRCFCECVNCAHVWTLKGAFHIEQRVTEQEE